MQATQTNQSAEQQVVCIQCHLRGEPPNLTGFAASGLRSHPLVEDHAGTQRQSSSEASQSRQVRLTLLVPVIKAMLPNAGMG